jgi:hypothetical protein
MQEPHRASDRHAAVRRRTHLQFHGFSVVAAYAAERGTSAEDGSGERILSEYRVAPHRRSRATAEFLNNSSAQRRAEVHLLCTACAPAMPHLRHFRALRAATVENCPPDASLSAP